MGAKLLSSAETLTEVTTMRYEYTITCDSGGTFWDGRRKNEAMASLRLARSLGIGSILYRAPLKGGPTETFVGSPQHGSWIYA